MCNFLQGNRIQAVKGSALRRYQAPETTFTISIYSFSFCCC
jgi:hypothetical protein